MAENCFVRVTSQENTRTTGNDQNGVGLDCGLVLPIALLTHAKKKS